MPEEEMMARFLARVGIEVIGLVEDAVRSFTALDILLYLFSAGPVSCSGTQLAENAGRPLEEVIATADDLAALSVLDVEEAEDGSRLYRLPLSAGRPQAVRTLVQIYQNDLHFRLWLVGRLIQVQGGNQMTLAGDVTADLLHSRVVGPRSSD